jgi:hypothetical protein
MSPDGNQFRQLVCLCGVHDRRCVQRDLGSQAVIEPTHQRIADWCRQYRHEPVRDQWAALKQVLAGHFAYFGITGNGNALSSFRTAQN